VVVRGLDGAQVGVGPAQQHVVQLALVRPRPRERLVQQVHVVHQRPARDGH
jgi:hypothetical protein